MKKADLFVIVMDGRLITKKVVYDTILYEVESVTETCVYVATNEEDGAFEINLEKQHIKLHDYHLAMKEQSYIFVGSIVL